MQGGLIAKLSSILDATLSKMARYDEGTFFAPILSITVCFPSYGKLKFYNVVLIFRSDSTNKESRRQEKSWQTVMSTLFVIVWNNYDPKSLMNFGSSISLNSGILRK